MKEIKEFTKSYVEKSSPDEDRLFKDFLDSKEPYTSIFANNPWLRPPDFKNPLKFDGQYWDTTVGRKHPFWKTKKLPLKKDSRTILNLRPDQNILLLMPASRPQELRYILPTFMRAAKKLQQKYPSLVVYIPSCRDSFDEIFKKAFRKYQVKGLVISQKDSAKLKPYIYSLTKIALCKSGTVNMELALHGIPQIVGYRVSRVTAFIAKKILNFKVRFISPVNLLVNKLIIPEFVQREFEEKKIFYKSCRILEAKSEKIKIRKGYAFLKKELGEEGVVQRAAKEIINSII